MSETPPLDTRSPIATARLDLVLVGFLELRTTQAREGGHSLFSLYIYIPLPVDHKLLISPANGEVQALTFTGVYLLLTANRFKTLLLDGLRLDDSRNRTATAFSPFLQRQNRWSGTFNVIAELPRKRYSQSLPYST